MDGYDEVIRQSLSDYNRDGAVRSDLVIVAVHS